MFGHIKGKQNLIVIFKMGVSYAIKNKRTAVCLYLIPHFSNFPFCAFVTVVVFLFCLDSL